MRSGAAQDRRAPTPHADRLPRPHRPAAARQQRHDREACLDLADHLPLHPAAPATVCSLPALPVRLLRRIARSPSAPLSALRVPSAHLLPHPTLASRSSRRNLLAVTAPSPTGGGRGRLSIRGRPRRGPPRHRRSTARRPPTRGRAVTIIGKSSPESGSRTSRTSPGRKRGVRCVAGGGGGTALFPNPVSRGNQKDRDTVRLG